jgi:hypothetical protein
LDMNLEDKRFCTDYLNHRFYPHMVHAHLEL